jgi:hypothetical protein
MRLELERRVGAVNAFINAQTWAGAQSVLYQNPELLDDITLELLDELRSDALIAGNDGLARCYDQTATIIARCRAVGLETAFGEVSGVRKYRPPREQVDIRDPGATPPVLTAYLEADGTEAMRIIEVHPEIINKASIRRIDDYIQHFRQQGDRVSVRSLEMRRDLLRQLLDSER